MKKNFTIFFLSILAYHLLGQDTLLLKKYKPDIFVTQPEPNEADYIKVKVTLICDVSKKRIKDGGEIISQPSAPMISHALTDEEGKGELVLISGKIYEIKGIAVGYAPKFKMVDKSSEFELNLKPNEKVRQAMKIIDKLLLDGKKLDAIRRFEAIESEFPDNQALQHFKIEKKLEL